MRIALRPFAASFVLLALQGCAVDQQEGEGPTAATESRLDVQACPGTRFVGPKIAGACDTIATPHGKYVGAQLFTSSAPQLAATCQWNWAPTIAGTRPDADDLARAPAFADRDCQVVAALGDTLGSSAAIASPLHDTFLAQAGAMTLPKLSSGAQPAAVRVAVVDTSPSGNPVTHENRPLRGRYDHGFNIGRVVRELTCPSDDAASPPCIGQVSNHLALSLVGTDVTDVTQGGYFGSQADLAVAIVKAVDAWSARKADGRGEPKRLVINLSVGWDRGRGYELPTSTPLHEGLSHPTNAVIAALRHASCRGALVIAAAGNRSGGTPETTGAMYPAAFESLYAPSARQCLALEGAGFAEDPAYKTFPPAGTYAPLLHAVSGVDATDKNLALTRIGSVTRMVAYGSEVVALDGAGFTDNMTGSSMAAAVVSAAAAGAWGYAPTVSPAELMAKIYAKAVALPASPNADVCITGLACGAVKRVSLPSAISAVCTSGLASCSGVLVPPVGAYQGKAPTWSVGWSALDPELALKTSVPQCVGGNCAAPSQTLVTKMAKPWVGPQPGSGGCDICGINSVGEFYLVLKQPWWESNVWFQTATLTVDTTMGIQEYQLDVTKQSNAFALAGINAANKVKGATLSFAPLGTYATTEQVMLTGN